MLFWLADAGYRDERCAKTGAGAAYADGNGPPDESVHGQTSAKFQPDAAEVKCIGPAEQITLAAGQSVTGTVVGIR